MPQFTRRRSTGPTGRRVRRRVMRRTAAVKKSLYARRGEPIYHFKRKCQLDAIVGAAGFAPYLNGINYNFGMLPNSTEFSTLFDFYRINKIVVQYFLERDPGAQAAATSIIPKLYHVVDNDDNVIPSNLNELREHAKCKVTVMSPYRPVTIVWRPSTLQLTFRNAVNSTFTPRWKQWIDFANTDVPHYGLKVGIDDLTNTSYVVRVLGTFYFSCRTTR